MNIKETIKSKVRDYVAETKRSIHTAKKIGLVLLVTNSMAFSTVAMQRGISGYSKEEAAFINSLNAVPVLYDIGFELGQRVFYNDKDFLKTKEEFSGFKNLIPRPYLGF